MSFCDWHVSLGPRTSKSICVCRGRHQHAFLSIPAPGDGWGSGPLHLRAFVTTALLQTQVHKRLFESLDPILLGRHPEVGWLDHMAVLFYGFWRSCPPVFHSGCATSHPYDRCTRVRVSVLTNTCYFLYVFVSNCRHLNGFKMVSLCILSFI